MTDVATTWPVERHATFDASGLLAAPAAFAPAREKISVRKLNFHYQDGNHALKDITVPIYESRVTAFIGSSGCGKSPGSKRGQLSGMYSPPSGARPRSTAALKPTAGDCARELVN